MAKLTTGIRNDAKLELSESKARRMTSATFISYTEYLTITTAQRYDVCDLTDALVRVLRNAGVEDGTMLVSAMHITASMYVNDHEPGLWNDTLQWLEKLAPFGQPYQHHQTGEDNGDAHLKRMVLGHQVIVPITAGKFDLGPWERIHYAEFDGCRPKRILVKVSGI